MLPEGCGTKGHKIKVPGNKKAPGKQRPQEIKLHLETKSSWKQKLQESKGIWKTKGREIKGLGN